jgi:hypothetical protein
MYVCTSVYMYIRIYVCFESRWSDDRILVTVNASGLPFTIKHVTHSFLLLLSVLLLLLLLFLLLLITAAAWFNARTVFACSNIGVMGSNSTRGMDLCVYPVFLLSCASSVLEAGSPPPPHQESYRLSIRV